MKQHFCKVAAACFYQLRRLRQIRRRVGQDVSHYTSGPGPRNFPVGLLQLGSGKSTAVDNRAAATSSKRCGASDFLSRSVGTRYTQSDPTTLAYYQVESAVQALHPHALHSPYVMAGVLYIYPTQFRLHLPGRVASADGRLTPVTSSYLNSGLNLESVHSRTLA